MLLMAKSFSRNSFDTIALIDSGCESTMIDADIAGILSAMKKIIVTAPVEDVADKVRWAILADT